jgi:hypothetical protein
VSEPNDALKAVEALCVILGDLVTTPGMGSPQLHMYSYRLKKLQAGCKALREGYRTGVAAEILDQKGSQT